MKSKMTFIKINTRGDDFKINKTGTRGTFLVGTPIIVSGKPVDGKKTKVEILSGIGVQDEVFQGEMEMLNMHKAPDDLVGVWKMDTSPYRINFSRKTLLPYVRPCDEESSEELIFLNVGTYNKKIVFNKASGIDIIQYAFDVVSRTASYILRVRNVDRASIKMRLQDRIDGRLVKTIIISSKLESGDRNTYWSVYNDELPRMEALKLRKIKQKKYVPDVLPSLIFTDDDVTFKKLFNSRHSNSDLSKKEIVMVNKKNINKTIKRFKKSGFRACAACGVSQQTLERIKSEFHIAFTYDLESKELKSITK